MTGNNHDRKSLSSDVVGLFLARRRERYKAIKKVEEVMLRLLTDDEFAKQALLNAVISEKLRMFLKESGAIDELFSFGFFHCDYGYDIYVDYGYSEKEFANDVRELQDCWGDQIVVSVGDFHRMVFLSVRNPETRTSRRSRLDGLRYRKGLRDGKEGELMKDGSAAYLDGYSDGIILCPSHLRRTS